MSFTNPFMPGAGHPPPFLAGRESQKEEFLRLLKQEVITENMVLTGLRGVGKTVLLNSFQPLATAESWLWVTAEFSEQTGVTEDNLAIRICTDLSKWTSQFNIPTGGKTRGIGFTAETKDEFEPFGYEQLASIYDSTPGLSVDKLKAVLIEAWDVLKPGGVKGVIFAYDEAQNLIDNSKADHFSLSLLLDTFQSIQRQGLPFMLALTGLPTLFPNLVDARTYSERMFRVVILESLNESDSREAITIPMSKEECPVVLSEKSVSSIVSLSGGYPYFIQFICREVYDAFIVRLNGGEEPRVPKQAIVKKLDTDFFAGRWARATDRQRQLLYVIALIDNNNDEFSVQDIAKKSKDVLSKPFSASHINQMLLALSTQGLVFKNRFGKYSYAVPLFGDFIKRQKMEQGSLSESGQEDYPE